MSKFDRSVRLMSCYHHYYFITMVHQYIHNSGSFCCLIIFIKAIMIYINGPVTNVWTRFHFFFNKSTVHLHSGVLLFHDMMRKKITEIPLFLPLQEFFFLQDVFCINFCLKLTKPGFCQLVNSTSANTPVYIVMKMAILDYQGPGQGHSATRAGVLPW